MVEALTVFLKGPVFVFCLFFAALGVLRLGFMHIHLIVMAFYNSWHHEYDRFDLVKAVLKKSLTFSRHQFWIRKGSFLWILLDTVFIGMLLLTLEHVAPVGRALDVHLFAMSHSLTSLLLVISCISIGARLYKSAGTMKQDVSTVSTALFWSLLLVILLSGYSASIINNEGLLRSARLVHVLLGDFLIFLIPFSRIGYWLVSPLANITSHLGVWLLPDSPKRDETSAYFKKLSEKNR